MRFGDLMWPPKLLRNFGVKQEQAQFLGKFSRLRREAMQFACGWSIKIGSLIFLIGQIFVEFYNFSKVMEIKNLKKVAERIKRVAKIKTTTHPPPFNPPNPP